MAADLYIHVFRGITEADLANFFSNTLGSKYFAPRLASDRRWEEAYKKIADTPGVHIGEVSWLKAALTENEEDAERFIPSAVQKINSIIGESLPTIDDALIGAVSDALHGPNATTYDVAEPDPVIAFLKEHKGERCFTVSW